MTEIIDLVLGWLNERKYELQKIDAKNAEVYQAKISNSHPVLVVFPIEFDDLVIVKTGMRLSGDHKEIINSITDPVEQRRIFNEFNYEIMTNTNVGSTKIIENNMIQGVEFESEMYLDGISKTLFFQNMVYVRSAALKFFSYVNKEL